MTREAAIKVFCQLLEAFDQCEHGDYFYDFGDMVCEAANVAISALREQSRWISVEERLPEASGAFLVFKCYRDNYKTIGVLHFCKAYKSYDLPKRGDYWVQYDSEYGDINMTDIVTHWMPLPEAPGAEC